MSVYNAVRGILITYASRIHGYLAEHSEVFFNDVQGQTNEFDLWKRYCSAMITPMQRISDDFWGKIEADKSGQDISSGNYDRKPQFRIVLRVFEENHIRFSEQKAQQLQKAWDLNFRELAARINGAMKYCHHRETSPQELRVIEIELSRLIQYELASCGVGPKVSRLMMAWPMSYTGPLFNHVIPIDSRWKKALATAGVDVEEYNLHNEDSYRLLENIICKAAWSLYLPPRLADGAVFGWIGERDEEENDS